MSALKKIFLFILVMNSLFCQDFDKIDIKETDIRSSKRSYISDELGNLFINVNVWGIKNSGIFSVPEGSTIIDVLYLLLRAI